jgi:hypothetical protein
VCVWVGLCECPHVCKSLHMCSYECVCLYERERVCVCKLHFYACNFAFLCGLLRTCVYFSVTVCTPVCRYFSGFYLNVIWTDLCGGVECDLGRARVLLPYGRLQSVCIWWISAHHGVAGVCRACCVRCSSRRSLSCFCSLFVSLPIDLCVRLHVFLLSVEFLSFAHKRTRNTPTTQRNTHTHIHTYTHIHTHTHTYTHTHTHTH